MIKGLDKVIGLLLVPMVLGYLDQTRYGIWLTLTSFVAWFSYLDIGLGYGLRNKFAEAIAEKNYIKAKIYVSTAYGIIIGITSVFIPFFLIVNGFIPWESILNVSQDLAADLPVLALLLFVFFCSKICSKINATLLVADQKPRIRDAINLSGRLLILVGVYVQRRLTDR